MPPIFPSNKHRRLDGVSRRFAVVAGVLLLFGLTLVGAWRYWWLQPVQMGRFFSLSQDEVRQYSLLFDEWGITAQTCDEGIFVPKTELMVARYLLGFGPKGTYTDLARGLSESEMSDYCNRLSAAGIQALAVGDAIIVSSREVRRAYAAIGPNTREVSYVFLETAATGRSLEEARDRLAREGISARIVGNTLLVRADQKFRGQRLLAKPTFVGVFWEWSPRENGGPEGSKAKEFLDSKGMEYIRIGKYVFVRDAIGEQQQLGGDPLYPDFVDFCRKARSPDRPE